MARKPRLEDLLAGLRAARDDARSPAGRDAMRQALRSGLGEAATRAARIVGQQGIESFASDLVAAFDTFLARPSADPGCGAKTAIVEALEALDHPEPGVYLRGIRHVQMEPAYGGRVDTAATLRGACALALVSMAHPEALLALAELLADPEPTARAAAARALGARGGDDAYALLILKLRLGDKDAAVTSECLTAVLRIAPSRALSALAPFLEHADPEVAEGAALALGQARVEGAFERLREWCERRAGTASEAAGFTALALLRREDALDHLVAMIPDAGERTAARIVSALAIARADAALRQRVREAVDAHGSASLERAFAEAFGRPAD
jgi:hypothetical protein